MALAHTRMLLTGVGAATVAVYVGVFLLATTDDRQDQFDDDAVRSKVSSACATLRADVDALPALPADAPPAERAARVQEQDRVVARLVADLRAVPGLAADEPGTRWLADWEALAAARRAWAAGGATGAFSPPEEGGAPITRRMEAVGVDACRVPTGLTTAP